MYLKCPVCGFSFGVLFPDDITAEEKAEIMECPCGAICEETEELHANVWEPPKWVLGENVPGILRIAAGDVVADLEREGYDVAVFDFEAAAVGAPHRRKRIAFVANRTGKMEGKHRGRERTTPSLENAGDGRLRKPGVLSEQQRRAEPCRDVEAVADSLCNGYRDRTPEELAAEAGKHALRDAPGCREDVSDPGGARLQRLQQHGTPDEGERQPESCGPTGKRRETVPDAQNTECDRRKRRPEPAGITGPAIRGQWAVEPGLGGVVNGIPNRLHGGGMIEEKYCEKSSAESDSTAGEVRDVRCDRGKAEQAPHGLFKAYRGFDSMYDMPCKGTHETSGYCGLCGMRERFSAEGSQIQSKALWESGVPCPVWENLRAQTMGRFWNRGEPDIPRVASGVKNRVDRIKCLGNAVVPQQFYPIFAAIAEIEENPGLWEQAGR